MDSILGSCSTGDFSSFSSEKYRIQDWISRVKVTIDNIAYKQLAGDRIKNDIKMAPVEPEIFSG